MAGIKHQIKSTGARLLDTAEPVITALVYLCGWSAILFVGSMNTTEILQVEQRQLKKDVRGNLPFW